MQVLIEAGADVHVRTETSKMTALMLAAFKRHVRIARMLVDAAAAAKTATTEEGGDDLPSDLVNAVDHDGSSALMWACNSGVESLVRLPYPTYLPTIRPTYPTYLSFLPTFLSRYDCCYTRRIHPQM